MVVHRKQEIVDLLLGNRCFLLQIVAMIDIRRPDKRRALPRIEEDWSTVLRVH